MNFELSGTLSLLSRTPATLSALLKGLPDTWTRVNEGGESFSPFDVVGHLIDGEETDWLPRARIILARKGETFVPYDRFRHRERNRGRSLDSLLEEFDRLRHQNLATMAEWHLGPSHFTLTAQHPSLGVVTLAQLLSAWTVHDLGHIAQVTRVMAKQYTEAVGPWKQYLPVLTDRT